MTDYYYVFIIKLDHICALGKHGCVYYIMAKQDKG